MNWKTLSSVVCLLTSIILVACGPSQAGLDATATQAAANILATQTAEVPPPTNTLVPTPTHKPTPTPTPTPVPLSAAEVFDLVAPSVVLIYTPAARGSGVLVEDGYIVTNAHVVWPFQEVQVVSPDGTRNPNAPVLNWDLIGDLAIIGPFQGPVTPAVLVDGEDLRVGSEVFLIGYPGEAGRRPQPTVTQGVISRFRESETIDTTYFQTDALVAGGQSGGVLVSERGEVIGISGLSTGEGFSLVASAADILPRIERLIAGEDVAGHGDRFVPLEGGQLEHNVRLNNVWDSRAYVINEPVGAAVEIQVESENDATFAISDPFGNVLVYVDDQFSGIESGSATIKFAVPHFAVIAQNSMEAGEFQVSSNHELIPYHDRDDGTNITVGQTLVASLDFPYDSDYFEIDLAEGSAVHITLDSVSFDPFLIVAYPGGTTEGELVSDDDSGGGMFGVNAELSYRAPHDGIYWIVVRATVGGSVGGYLLAVNERYADAPTPMAPLPTPIPLDTPFGSMALYESARYPFAIQRPTEWREQSPEEGLAATFISEQGEGLFITEEDMVALGVGEMTLEEHVDVVISILESSFHGFQLLSREQTVTEQGLPAEIIVCTAQAGLLKFSRFFYIHEGKVAFNASYIAGRARYDELDPLITYSYSTFQVTE